jgi:anti-sigma factor ChrR (cupin superfamily)
MRPRHERGGHAQPASGERGGNRPRAVFTLVMRITRNAQTAEELTLDSVDGETRRVTMLVRLEPGVEYPPHVHAGVEELYLLDGELWIDDRRLHPGDYHRAVAGTGDKRVWSEGGCTCVLITSHRDILK